jgi:hypothetical protein
MQEQNQKPVTLVDSDQKDPPSHLPLPLAPIKGMYASGPFSDTRIGAASTGRSYQVPDHIKDQYID